MREITAEHGFENDVRRTLRFNHKFTPENLKRVQGIFTDTLTKIKSPNSLRASHFDEAMKAMSEHPEWRHLNESQRGKVEDTFKLHLGIKRD